MKDIRKVLTIAGSDPSGGAGIQADIKTITAHKMYAMNISTGLTVQNTTGIRDTFVIPPDFIAVRAAVIEHCAREESDECAEQDRIADKSHISDSFSQGCFALIL